MKQAVIPKIRDGSIYALYVSLPEEPWERFHTSGRFYDSSVVSDFRKRISDGDKNVDDYETFRILRTRQPYTPMTYDEMISVFPSSVDIYKLNGCYRNGMHANIPNIGRVIGLDNDIQARKILKMTPELYEEFKKLYKEHGDEYLKGFIEGNADKWQRDAEKEIKVIERLQGHKHFLNIGDDELPTFK